MNDAMHVEAQHLGAPAEHRQSSFLERLDAKVKQLCKYALEVNNHELFGTGSLIPSILMQECTHMHSMIRSSESAKPADMT